MLKQQKKHIHFCVLLMHVISCVVLFASSECYILIKLSKKGKQKREKETEQVWEEDALHGEAKVLGRKHPGEQSHRKTDVPGVPLAR